MMRRQWLFSSLVLSLLLAGTAVAAIPHLIRYQGTAVDAKGVPLEGPYDLTFRLYDAVTGGTVKWQESQPAIQLTAGHFSVLLGQVTPLNVDWSLPLWLSVQVGPDPELTPRQQITGVPLAMRAELADQATQLTQPITPALITPQGAGSGLDADLVDGKQAADFINRGETAGGDLSGTYPNPIVLNAGFKNIQVFSTSGVWIRPPGINKVYVRLWGAGGGGGGGSGSDNGNPGSSVHGGGQGGGGGYCEGIVPVTGDVTITIGMGGTGGSGGAGGGGAATDGTDGSNSSFGSLVASAGKRGLGGGRSVNPVGIGGVGGAGGNATGGAININGVAGQAGGTATAGAEMDGGGSSIDNSQPGRGGFLEAGFPGTKGLKGTSPNINATSGGSGSVRGGGGGGGGGQYHTQEQTQSGGAGGRGGDGYCIIMW